MTRKALMPLAAVLPLAIAIGCASPIEAPQTGSARGDLGASTSSQALKLAVVTGVVTAPPGVIAAGGGQVIAWGGGQVIAPGGGQVIAPGGAQLRATGGYHVAAFSERPLAGAEVYLAYADGREIPGLARTLTNASGSYRIARVPTGFAYKVVVKVRTAENKEATLQSLAYTGASGAIADVSTATTLVTAAVTQNRTDTLGAFDPATFAQAAEATASALSAEPLPDLADEQALAAKAAAIAEQTEVLRSAVASLKAEVAAAPPAGALERAVENLKQDDMPTPGASQLPPPATQVSTLVGGEPQELSGPQNVVVDAVGNLYIADTLNHRIRKFDAATGELTTLAGSGTAGFADGKGAAAQFDRPRGLALDAQGRLYVADSQNHRIRVIRPDGLVETLAGTGEAGAANGPGDAAQFFEPVALALRSDGTLVVVEAGGNRLRVVTIGRAITADEPATGETEVTDEPATGEAAASPEAVATS